MEHSSLKLCATKGLEVNFSLGNFYFYRNLGKKKTTKHIIRMTSGGQISFT